MNSSHCQNPGTRSNRRRVAATLSLSLLVSFSLLPAAAQRKQKRITSVWTTTTAEGSRVHVVSNSQVNDYEGYTRGGRFYVKIPLADLPSARGSLLGRGFDDVQIQRYGDGIIISFRLQPGTTARVEQSTNRLDIVFSTLAGARSAVSASSNVDAANRIRGRRIADAAGPSPSSSSASRERPLRKPATTKNQPVTGASAGLKDAGSNAAQDRSSLPPEATASSRSNEVTSSAGPAPGSSPSATASPTAIANVSGSSASASPAGTPVSQAAPASRETSSPTTTQTAANSGDNDWRSRARYWRVWAELNWVPLLIGGLIGLTLLVLLVFWRGAKRGRKAEVEAAAAPATVASKQLASPARSSDAAKAASASQIATGSGASATTGHTHSSHPMRRATDKNAGEEQEREVIEL